MSLALKTLFGAVASAVLASSAAYAAGLGKLTVLSSLGQPLRAEIELTAVSNEEANGLVAKLAPPDAFRLANIEFNPALLSLRFAVEQRNGRQYIKISSSQPVNEPFVDMLLELSWSSGRLVREYTFLLDPAELRATQSAQVAALPVDVMGQGSRTSAPASQPASQPAAQPVRQAAQPAAKETPQPQAARPVKPKLENAEQAAAPAPSGASTAAGSAVSQYKVKSGDTLGRIASQVKPAEISLDMMLVALYRANPDAFIGNNMNRLKSGQILSVPDNDAIRGSGEGAHGVVVAHAADFNAYRNKLAGQVANAAPAKQQDSSQSATGKITAKVEERPTAANESKDQLKLSKAAAAGAGGKSATAAAEDKIAKEKALADATARVKELERNVNDLEKLMVVKTKTGADAKPAADVAAAAKPAAPAVAAKASVPAVVAAPAPAQASALAQASAPAKPAAKSAPAPKKAAAPAAPAEPTIVEMLMDNATYIGGGLAIALLALFGLSRRKKQEPIAPTEPSILGAPTDQAHSLFAETGGQSIDTSNSVFNSSFAPSASQLDTNEVDPVAEADVYIAYGRDAQAEEILKEALRNHPERNPVRLKLLEIYAARKDQRSFEMQAGELYGMTKGEGDEWAQAAALGLSIDPSNPLYAGAPAAAPISSGSPEAIAEQAILNQMHADGVSAGTEPEELLDLDFSPAAAAPAAAAAQPPAQVAQPADDNTLDFDLGDLSFEPVSLDEPAAPAIAQASPAAAAHDMAFTSAASPEAAADPEQTFDLAFDMDFDAPVAATPAVESQPLGSISLELDGNGLSKPDFNMDDLAHAFDLPTLPESATTAPAASHDLSAMSFELPSSTGADPFALPDPPYTAPAHSAAPAFDMSSLDLDLPATEPAGRGAEEMAIATSSQADMSASHMEMETKLDLAIAYQEIGDKEGARELLDEVIKGGSHEQVSKANAMRAKLA
jgi:pilus assembly protein FimV